MSNDSGIKHNSFYFAHRQTAASMAFTQDKSNITFSLIQPN